jgi:FkbM family methyltransferase
VTSPGSAADSPGGLERLLLAYARGFPVRRGKMRVVNALWRLAAGPNAQREAVTRYAGFRMPCDLAEALQRQYYFFGTYFLEEHILRAWTDAALDARTVFDVGANSGIYSLAALAAQPAAQVHAFEATPEIAARLRRTAGLNRLAGLTVHAKAVSDVDGVSLLRRCGDDVGGNEGMNYIVRDVAGAEGERVPTIRLDSACREMGIDRIDLLKLDIQGAEGAALDGARDLIADRRIGAVFMELNWGAGDPCPATRAVRLLEEAGYVFASPAEPLRLRPAGEWLRTLSDVIARPGASPKAIRA